MKKLSLLFVCVILALFSFSALAADPVNVVLDGEELTFDVPAQIINDRTMVPMRKIFESLGASVEWLGETRTVVAVKEDVTVTMQIDNTVMTVNGESVTLDTPPQLVDDRTLVPVRAVAESFKATVDWDGETRTVFIKASYWMPIADLTTPLEKLDSAIDDLNYTEPRTLTTPINPTWTSGYMTVDGTIYGNETYNYSNKISAAPGEVIEMFREERPSDTEPVRINSARFVTVFNGDTVVEELGGASVPFPFTMPEGADGVVFSIAASYGNATRTKSLYDEEMHKSVLTPDVEALQADVKNIYSIVANEKANRLYYNFDVSAGNTYTATEQLEDLCAYRICFFAKISAITDIVRIGKGIGQTYGGGIGFDGTNLYQYMGTAAEPVRTQAHGLQLKDYVAVILDAQYSIGAKCTISTNGGSYTWDIPYWRSRYGVLTVSSGDNLTDCELSYTCEGLVKDTWLYGDSYFSNTGTDRWTSYLINTGHTNYLLNGYPGRNSVQALNSLKVDLSMNRTPKRIIWCMGMNDKDGESSPNANWLASVEEVMEICKEKHIELILATIPNVTSTNTKNTLKNAYVVESGYRYIDFANAVSADGSSTWYDGMLNADGVHPDEQGAIALFNCAVMEVPELLL